MPNKYLNLIDRINNNLKDEISLTGNNFNQNGTTLKGEAIFYNELGEEIFRKKNTILVGGRRFVLEKIFNLDPSTISRINLNSIYGVNTAEDPLTGVGPRREKSVCLFGVGVGGSELSFGSTYAPNSVEYDLYKPIPLRYVDESNDLSTEEKKNYYLRVKTGDKIAYYLKRFSNTPKLVMKQGDVNFIPSRTDNQIFNDDNTAIIREAVDVYSEVQFKITKDDVREWFIAQESIKQARINEICLYYAYQPQAVPGAYIDYRGIEAFSKITFDNEPLGNLTKEIYVTYRIYA